MSFNIVVQNIEQYANFAAFPAIGTANILYIDEATNTAYYWGGAAYASVSGGGGSIESFYLTRIETIDNNNTTPLEYFTEPQNGTEISNTITAAGGVYNFSFYVICANTSTGGSVVINAEIGGVSVFSQPYEHEPKDTANVFYVNIQKRVTLAAGTNTIQIQLSNNGGGTGRVFEAGATITKV